MFTKKEISVIAISAVVMTLALSFINFEIRVDKLPLYLVFSIIVLFCSVFSKKITASILNLKLEVKLWGWQRWGIAQRSVWKHPVPIGLILPLLSSFLFGFRYFLCLLTFDITTLPARVAKKYGIRRYADIMEWDDSLIVFYSTIPLLLLAIISKFFFPYFLELGKITMYYSLLNLIPISKLDGTRLFFGSIPLFIFTWILAIFSAIIIFL